MKIFFRLFFLTALTMHAKAQDTIPASGASKNIGRTVIVCDKVFRGRWLENANGQPTLINMGDAYPNSPFTFVIFGEERKKFDYKPEEFLVDKQVCVSGLITAYKDKPQIFVKESSQER